MSVQSEIDRLAGIKQDIRTAIVAKGQSVSDTDAFATYADKIAAIETGSAGVPVAYGVYTGTSSTTTFTISDLGFEPKRVTIVAKNTGFANCVECVYYNPEWSPVMKFTYVNSSYEVVSNTKYGITLGTDSVTFANAGGAKYSGNYFYIIVGE